MRNSKQNTDSIVIKKILAKVNLRDLLCQFLRIPHSRSQPYGTHKIGSGTSLELEICKFTFISVPREQLDNRHVIKQLSNTKLLWLNDLLKNNQPETIYNNTKKSQRFC